MTSWKSEFYCSNSDVIFLVTSSSLHKNQLVDKNLPFLINDNACSVSILYFIKKKILLVIFWTLFSKKCHFLPILAKFLILPEYIKVIIKSCSKYHIYFTFVQLLIITLYYLGKHRNFAKSGKNWPFFTKQSPKNDKQKIFLDKIQNAHNIWFPHRFSILDQKVIIEGVPDHLAPQVPENQA